MACADKIAKDILNSCDEIPRAGYESIAWAINREDIDSITYDGTIPNLVEAITLNSLTTAYTITAVKKEANAGFDLVTGDDIPDTYQQYFSFKPYEHDAESVKNFDDMEDLVIIAELKGDKTEGCFVIYGLEKGLYKSAGTQRGNDNVGLPQYEFASLEGQGERYSRFVFWDTDYATTKALIEALVVSYGPELHTNANAASDPNGNEANATTGFTEASLNGTGANVFQSQASVKNVGSYALEADCNDTPTSSARFYVDLAAAPFNLVNGDQVKITFDWRHVGTGIFWEARLAADVGLITNATTIDTVSTTDIVFQSITYEFTYSADTRYFGFRELNGLNDGGVYVDNLSVKKKI